MVLSEDKDKQREFVWLLNNCLSEKTRKLGLKYFKKLGYYYFLPKRNSLKQRRIRSGTDKKTYRTVFKAYPSKQTPEKISFCRHSAFEGYFKKYGSKWYLEITPTYHFTRDGRTFDGYYEDKLKKIKLLEKPTSVRHQLLAYARLLSEEYSLYEEKYPYLQFGQLANFTLPFGIDDKSWLPPEHKVEYEIAMEKGRLLFNYED